MPRHTKPLSVAEVRAAKPADKDYKLFDGAGLFLLVNRSGAKYWRLKYRVNGKEKLMALGQFPEVSLVDARELREAARKQIRQGVDPLAGSGGATVKTVAEAWYKKQTHVWSPRHAETVRQRLDNYILPVLGKSPISDVTARQVLALLESLEKRQVIETAHRVRGICGQIWCFAVAQGHCERDITADLRGALTPVKPVHMAAVTSEAELAGVLRAIDGYDGSFIVQAALKLLPMLLCRPGELRSMRWEDIEDGVWRFAASKTGQPHQVALPTQALAILETVKPVTGHGPYVFPTPRALDGTRPLSENAFGAALKRMDIRNQTAHGFRATARTMLAEKFGYRPEVIEMALAHTVKDPLGRAYNRTQWMDERKEMLQEWADYLESLLRTESGGREPNLANPESDVPDTSSTKVERELDGAQALSAKHFRTADPEDKLIPPDEAREMLHKFDRDTLELTKNFAISQKKLTENPAVYIDFQMRANELRLRIQSLLERLSETSGVLASEFIWNVEVPYGRLERRCYRRSPLVLRNIDQNKNRKGKSHFQREKDYVMSKFKAAKKADYVTREKFADCMLDELEQKSPNAKVPTRDTILDWIRGHKWG